MKNLILIFISALLFSCGGSDDDVPDPAPNPPPVNNTEPSVPELVTPNDGALCTNNPLDFVWNASTDPDSDIVSYYIQLATNDSFSQDLQVGSTSNLNTTFTLIKGEAYYWRVSAKDSKNKSSDYSATRKFYSESEGISNHLPYAAAIVSPELDADIIDATTTLKWSASDVDNDPLTYDVYFGKSNPPELIAENITAKEKSVDLNETITYYWKIVVKDDKGGESIGQVWSFNAK